MRLFNHFCPFEYTTGDWFWETWNTYHWVAYVDTFWIFMGLTALYLSFFLLKVKATTDKPKLPQERRDVQADELLTPEAKELILKAKSA